MSRLNNFVSVSVIFGQLLLNIIVTQSFKLHMSANNGVSSSLSVTKDRLTSVGKIVTSVLGTTSLLSSATTVHAKESTLALDNSPKITNLLFIRHAESYNNIINENIRNEENGQLLSTVELKSRRSKLRQSDSLLSERGEIQVNLLQNFIDKGGMQKSTFLSSGDASSQYTVISSPMRRALLTSQAVSNGLSKPVVVHPLLYEAGGCYTSDANGNSKGLPGSTSQEIEQIFPTYRCLPGMEKGWYHKSNKKETPQAFHTRVDQISDWIWSIHRDKNNELSSLIPKQNQNLIIVGHGIFFVHYYLNYKADRD